MLVGACLPLAKGRTHLLLLMSLDVHRSITLLCAMATHCLVPVSMTGKYRPLQTSFARDGSANAWRLLLPDVRGVMIHWL